MTETFISTATIKPEAGSLLFDALEARWAKYKFQAKTGRKGLSEESVHDLRVAARRLLAVLDLASALQPHLPTQKVRRALKTQLENLDHLRDVQMMAVLVAESVENLPELKPFGKHLGDLGKRLLNRARNQIRQSKPSGMKQRIKKIRASMKEQMRAEYFSTNIIGEVDNLYLQTMRNYVLVDAALPSSIHLLRLSFKKFRYTTEIVHPLIDDYPNMLFDRMHEYQGAMGKIQDVDAFLAAIDEFDETNTSAFDQESIRRFFETLRSELVADFIEDKSELLTFWRAAPDQPFPWET